MGDQLGRQVRTRRCQGRRFDDRGDLLPELLVRHPDHSRVRDRRMGDQDVLDLTRVDVDPAGDDQIGPPVDEPDIAVVVDTADVADRGPAACVVRLGRLVRGMVIAELPADLGPQDAGLAGREFLAVLAQDMGDADDRSP
ncbi:hypothetical protein [Pseudonocardia sp. GCM10023141]|uniref:hypothetical protein n=1 Tax=Pseudonocardia sp. GCM10023141 TaxID=3252653 RepID=UPI00361A018C